MSGVFPADLRAAAALGGEMGQRLLAFDWAAHPLGDPAGWPAATRTTVATALASRFPTVLWLGERLRLIYNDTYIPMLGDKHPAAFGEAAADVWWDIWDVVGPMLASVVKSGVATWSDDLLLLLVNDGRRRERYFTFTYSPIIGTGGGTEGVFCAVSETTERVLGERRMQALNALAAALIDAQSAEEVLTAAVEVCGSHNADLPFAAAYLADGSLPAARLHRATASVDGLLPPSLASLLPEPPARGDGVRVVDGLPSRVAGLPARFGEDCPDQAMVIPIGEVTDGEPAGALVLGLNRWRPLDDLYRGFCGLLADQVSAALASAKTYEAERRRAEALAALDRAKTAFLTNVSHEFRTPLTLMLGPLEEAISGAAGDAALTERLEAVRRNGRRLLRLVNSLLDFSRLEAGQASPQLTVADVGTLTAGIASSFTDVCRTAGIELVLDCRPVWGEIDIGMWETIVLNLVSNAFKYTLSGSITVRAGPASDGGAEMAVEDTGTGIAAEDLPHLFERFYRAADAAGRSAEGSGIGLALVRSMTEIHGGTIGVHSTPGAGTTVTVRLPAARARPPVPPAGQPHPAAAAPVNPYVDEALQWLDGEAGEAEHAGRERSGRPLVLVADDNADMRRHLARILRSRWDVVVAADGRRALELARGSRPDLLVADVMMPAMDGFELVRAIRGDPELAQLPVIMLSARAGVEASGDGLAAGADHYLVKPFSSADLVNQVAARLEAAGRDRARTSQGGLRARRDLALAELGTALGGARSADQLLALLLGSPLCSLGATAAALGLLEETSGLLRITYSGDVRPEVTDRYHLVDMDAPHPMVDVIRSGKAVIVPGTAGPAGRYAEVAADSAPNARASVVQPLRAHDGSVFGALALTWPQPRGFSSAEAGIIERAAGHLSRATARLAVTEREHQLAMSFQERLLDLGAGSTAAVVSASYQPAGQSMRVGGDWYTATPLDGRRIGVCVGDVVGHGLAAAAVMSQLRSALGLAALAASEPGAVLDLLDRYAGNFPQGAFTTVAYAVVDAAAGTIDYTCAGHPYPIIVAADGTVSFLRDGRRPPLAARTLTVPAAAGHAALPPGSLLVLYTDGLIERRAEALDVGFARLAAAAASCAQLPTGAVCETLLSHLAGEHGYLDDVALIAVRPVGTTHASHVDALRADTDELAGARHRLRAWLGDLGIGQRKRHDIVLSAGEAVSNAIEHGSALDPQRTVGIEAFASEDGISVCVSDSGHWSKDSTATSRLTHRGRGLKLIHGLSSEVRTDRTVTGTRMTMTYHPGTAP